MFIQLTISSLVFISTLIFHLSLTYTTPAPFLPPSFIIFFIFIWHSLFLFFKGIVPSLLISLKISLCPNSHHTISNILGVSPSILIPCISQMAFYVVAPMTPIYHIYYIFSPHVGHFVAPLSHHSLNIAYNSFYFKFPFL